MSQIFEAISSTQPLNLNLPTKQTRRLWVIVKDGNNFLLEQNLNPAYNGITSFPNTTLSYSIDQQFIQVELIEKAKNLIKTRLWYINLSFSHILKWGIKRSFHKPDKEYNECWLYDNSILIFNLVDQSQIEVNPEEKRSIVWKSESELNEYFQTDGTNGSSWLIRKLYKIDWL
jgi:hypothetical protein